MLLTVVSLLDVDQSGSQRLTLLRFTTFFQGLMDGQALWNSSVLLFVGLEGGERSDASTL